jgi:hypothetical protein
MACGGKQNGEKNKGFHEKALSPTRVRRPRRRAIYESGGLAGIEIQ